MEYTEIKIDKETLPRDGEVVVFETHKVSEYVGFFYENENAFVPINGLPITSFDVIKWKKNKIYWEFFEWADKSNAECWIQGIDDFGNDFQGIGVMFGDEIFDWRDVKIKTNKQLSYEKTKLKFKV